MLPFTSPSVSSRVASAGWHRLAVLLFAGGGLLAGGCATGEIEMVATIAGGETLHVPLARGGAALTQAGGVQINLANFTFNADKKMLYTFAFTDSRGRALRSVRVEDVSDETAVPLVEQAEPKLTAEGRWRGDTAPFDFGDPRVAWLSTISNTLRVFRFTLTFADGQTLVLHQGTFFPAAMKSVLRQALGQNY